MLCPRCHGTGKLTGTIAGVTQCYPLIPCDYDGCVQGHVHCCDGLAAQPDTETTNQGTGETS